jgi:cytochrome b561
MRAPSAALSTASASNAYVLADRGTWLSFRSRGYNFHKSLGVLILILMILRLINRLAVGAPIADPNIESWQKTVSSAVHGLLYVLLLAMPVVGYIANSAYGAPTPFFGLFTLPKIVGDNPDLAKQLFALHRWVGFLVIALVLAHVGAAVYHQFIRRDEVLKRMLPTALGGFPAPLSPRGHTE